MEMKKLIIVALSLAYINNMTGNHNALAELSSTLINLEAKAEELNKISEKEHGQFYKKLRFAIKSSLENMKLDAELFSQLPQDSALNAAKDVLDSLFGEEKGSGRNEYRISRKADGVNNFTFTPPGYQPIKAPLDNIVDQIVLISKLVNFITTNYNMDNDISILSIDTFDNIFYTYFALALFKTKLTGSTPSEGKLNLTILGDSLHQDDFEAINKSLEKLGDTARYDETIGTLIDSDAKFDIYLFNRDTKFDKESVNAVVAINNKDTHNVKQLLFPRFSKIPKSALAFVTKNISEDKRDTIFADFIKSALGIKTGIYLDPEQQKTDISNYHLNYIKAPYYYLPYIISQTRSSINKSQLFILDRQQSQIVDLSLPITNWPELLYEITMILYPLTNTKYQCFIFDDNSKEFIKYDGSISKKTKVRKITWK